MSETHWDNASAESPDRFLLTDETPAGGITTRSAVLGLLLVLVVAYALPSWIVRSRAPQWFGGGYLALLPVFGLLLMALLNRWRLALPLAVAVVFLALFWWPLGGGEAEGTWTVAGLRATWQKAHPAPAGIEEASFFAEFYRGGAWIEGLAMLAVAPLAFLLRFLVKTRLTRAELLTIFTTQLVGLTTVGSICMLVALLPAPHYYDSGENNFRESFLFTMPEELTPLNPGEKLTTPDAEIESLPATIATQRAWEALREKLPLPATPQAAEIPRLVALLDEGAGVEVEKARQEGGKEGRLKRGRYLEHRAHLEWYYSGMPPTPTAAETGRALSEAEAAGGGELARLNALRAQAECEAVLGVLRAFQEQARHDQEKAGKNRQAALVVPALALLEEMSQKTEAARLACRPPPESLEKEAAPVAGLAANLADARRKGKRLGEERYAKEKLPAWFLRRPVIESGGKSLGEAPSTVLERWLGPLVRWLSLLFCFYFMQFCLALLFRRQWIDHEKLMFVHAEPLLGAVGAQGGQVEGPKFWRNKGLWWGAGIAGVLFLLEGLHGYWPQVPSPREALNAQLDLRARINTPPWNAMLLAVSVEPWAVALAFLLTAEISLSLWFFAVVDQILRVVVAALKLPYEEWLAVCGSELNTGAGAVGAIYVFVLFLVFSARHHCLAMLARVLGPRVYRLAPPLGRLLAAVVIFGTGRAFLEGLNPGASWPACVCGGIALAFLVAWQYRAWRRGKDRAPGDSASDFSPVAGQGVKGTAAETSSPEAKRPRLEAATTEQAERREAKWFIGALLGLSGAVAYALYWFTRFGSPLGFAAFLVFSLIFAWLYLSRLLCEAGLIGAGVAAGEWLPQKVYCYLFGYPGGKLFNQMREQGVPETLLQKIMLKSTILPGLVLWVFLWPMLWWHIHLMPMIMTGYRLGVATVKRQHRLIALSAAGLVLASVLASYRAVDLTYQVGANRATTGMYSPIYRVFKNTLKRDILVKDRRHAPDGSYLKMMTLGGSVMGGLLLLRHLFYWWPLHPLGYIARGIDQGIWVSFLIGWFLKWMALRYGGGRWVSRATPFFVGLLLGQFFLAGVFYLAGIVNGEMRFFPLVSVGDD